MLSQSAKSVQDALHKKNIQAKVVEMPMSTRTAEDAAKAVGCNVAQIVKSLIFRTKHAKKGILVLVSGANRVNEKAISSHTGEEIVKADADFVREITGFAIGGIPPIGHKQKIDTYIDEDLLEHEEVWAAAGTPNAVFNLQASMLIEITGGKTISVKI